MYAHFYRLAEDPFNLTPDPKFHYVNEATREAMASLLYGIESRKGFVSLVGEAGTGKTTLLKRVVEEIEAQARIVFVFNPAVSFEELLEFICNELGIAAEGRRRLSLIEKLNAYLLEQLTEGRNVVVMIDEAQTLDDSVLEELRLLSNLETSKEKILQIVLSGQPELDEKMRRPALRQLRQRIGARAVLKPMRGREIGAYIETRLRSAGSREGQIFTSAALRRIWKASEGIPRVVNVICDNAMMIAFAEGKKRITAKVIREAVRDLESTTVTSPRQAFGRRWLGSPIVRYAGATVVAGVLSVPFALSLLERPELTARFGASVARHERIAPATRTPPAGEARPQPAPEIPATPAQRWNEAGHAAPVVVGRLPDPAEPDAAEVASNAPAVAAPVAPSVPAQIVSGDPHVPSAERVDSAQDAQILQDTIRRAELLARSTAARLFSESAAESPGASGRAHAAQPEPAVHQSTPAPTAAASTPDATATTAPIAPAAAPLAPPAAAVAGVRSAPPGTPSSVPDASSAPGVARPLPAAPSAQPTARPGVAAGERTSAKAAVVVGDVTEMGEEEEDTRGTAEIDPLPQQVILEVPPPQPRSPSDLIAERVQEVPLIEAARAESAAAEARAQVVEQEPAMADSNEATRTDAPQPDDLRYFELAAQALERQLDKTKQAVTAASADQAQRPLVPPRDPAADHGQVRETAASTTAEHQRSAERRPPAPAPQIASASQATAPPPRASSEPQRQVVRELAMRSRSTRPGMVLGPRRGIPLVGRLVEVGNGDTVWDIAIRYYGYAGPRTLSAILDSNPQLRNPRHLVAGDQLYLPFLKPQQMVSPSPDGSYRVLLSSSPTRAGIDAAADWLSERMPSLKLRSDEASMHGDGYVLYAFGFTSKDAALKAADAVLVQFDQLSGEGGRRHAHADVGGHTPTDHG